MESKLLLISGDDAVDRRKLGFYFYLFIFLTKQQFKASLKQYFNSNPAAEGKHEQVVKGNKPDRS